MEISEKRLTISVQKNLYGAIHASDDGKYTICGERLDENWHIIDNVFSDSCTCEKCFRIISEKNM